MSWPLLPPPLRLSILQYHLASPGPITHATHLANLVHGDLEPLVATQNREVVDLALEAYYRGNVFVVQAERARKEPKEEIVFRPRGKHARLMGELRDETRVAGKTVARKDSGAVLPDGEVVKGAGIKDGAAANLEETIAGAAKQTPSHGWYWEMHKAKLERSMRLAKALGKRDS